MIPVMIPADDPRVAGSVPCACCMAPVPASRAQAWDGSPVAARCGWCTMQCDAYGRSHRVSRGRHGMIRGSHVVMAPADFDFRNGLDFASSEIAQWRYVNGGQPRGLTVRIAAPMLRGTGVTRTHWRSTHDTHLSRAPTRL